MSSDELWWFGHIARKGINDTLGLPAKKGS